MSLDGIRYGWLRQRGKVSSVETWRRKLRLGKFCFAVVCCSAVDLGLFRSSTVIRLVQFRYVTVLSVPVWSSGVVLYAMFWFDGAMSVVAGLGNQVWCVWACWS